MLKSVGRNAGTLAHCCHARWAPLPLGCMSILFNSPPPSSSSFRFLCYHCYRAHLDPRAGGLAAAGGAGAPARPLPGHVLRRTDFGASAGRQGGQEPRWRLCAEGGGHPAVRRAAQLCRTAAGCGRCGSGARGRQRQQRWQCPGGVRAAHPVPWRSSAGAAAGLCAAGRQPHGARRNVL